MSIKIMMNQLIEFSINHWEMVAVFFVILATVVYVESKNGAKSVNASTAINMMNSENAVILDIRPNKEFKSGHITDAINIPATKVKESLNTLEKHKDSPIIVVCKAGLNSSATAKDLKKEGFAQVYKLQGGVSDWQASSLPLVKG
ncbi:rhodanese-like domain-containing protein [Marinomonas sp. C2222]|uniref:Rhodanese-like domain-containing protein n=1 Tax=Marinomonas sargassi TaxID=2984494 RepID=A0ABT2YPT7_9GAMM|nr:rhodanese-like domain-containing protein [Marinomonas sargassi]MCV2401699.1 rhodanese-like domain-containing protein [Marinomonas sargassi]